MSTAKLSYDYLIQNPQAQRIIKKFNKGIYGKVLDSPEENTAKFLEHHRKYDMLNEITVLQDLSYVRDTEERNGLKQNERLINYRQARDLFDNYEGIGTGGTFYKGETAVINSFLKKIKKKVIKFPFFNRPSYIIK